MIASIMLMDGADTQSLRRDLVTMLTSNYLDFCEALWRQWLDGGLHLPEPLAKRFQLDHAPEPYLRFGNGTNPLCVLLTNPGGGMDHQRREVVQSGESCISKCATYDEASRALASFYQEALQGTAAGAKINAVLDLQKLIGADSTITFESVPFHSKSLPGKRKLTKQIQECDILRDYSAALSETLKQNSVVALSAVGPWESISKSTVTDNRWLEWQSTLLGIDPNMLKTVSLATKGHKTSSAFLYQSIGDHVRGFVLAMGGPHFPAATGLGILAATLTSARGLQA